MLVYNTHPFLRHAFLGQNCAYYMQNFTVTVILTVELFINDTLHSTQQAHNKPATTLLEPSYKL